MVNWDVLLLVGAILIAAFIWFYMEMQKLNQRRKEFELEREDKAWLTR